MTTRLSWGSKVVLALAGSLIAACSPNKSQRWNHPAPSRAQDVGIVVQAEQTKIEKFLEQSDKRGARILSVRHGLYELFGTSLEDVRRELKPRFAERNIYFQRVAPNEKTPLETFAALLAQSEEQPPSPQPTATPALKECQRDTRSPSANIKVLTAENEVANGAVTLGKELVFSSEGSAPHPDFMSQLTVAWFVRTPQFSQLPQEIHIGGELHLTPDALGPYDVIMLVQDERAVCSTNVVRFAVTDNPTYTGPGPVRDLSLEELSSFTQLADLHAKEAWEVAKGKGVIVAIVDSGVHYNHRDLSPNISVNLKEIPGNGLDDDGNGFVDDEYGWDFANSDNRPFDDDGHGTHVAGLAAAANFGIAREAKILPIKALNGLGGGDLASVAAGIRYAVDAGAKVVNLSLGSHDPKFKALQEAISYAETNNVLVVVASGNGHPVTGMGLNIDENPVYPASLENENILTVAASDKGQLTSYSNYGVKTVDVAAPGGSENTLIVSAALQNPAGETYIGQGGTSMSAPLIAGVAALLLSKDTQMTPKQLKETLVRSSDLSPSMKDKLASGGVVNARRALDFLSNLAAIPLALGPEILPPPRRSSEGEANSSNL